MALWLFIVFSYVLLLPAQDPAATSPVTFSNPILPAPSQDPWIVREAGSYYYCESRGNTITVRRTTNPVQLRDARPIVVWTAPPRGANSKDVWAPELHRIGERWYIYFAADDGANAHHRMWVLESERDDAFGPYRDCRELETGGWAIDGTVLHGKNGRMFFVWSGWPGSVDGLQQLYIAPMPSPVCVDTPRILLTTPMERWERTGMPICEGPEALQRGDRTFIVYSASGSWTPDYCLGMLVNEDGDFLNPTAWQKSGPVFARTDSVWGVGHCSFVLSPDSTESWILYHAKESAEDGWNDRSVRAQRFIWDESGFPVFGTPVPIHVDFILPSGARP